MRVLQVWDVAGVSWILSKFLRKRGVISDVITRKIFDKSEFKKVYPNYALNYDISAKRFYILVLKKSANYDLLHVHSIDRFVPLLKMYHRKPVILHYHGSDIRGQGKSLTKKIFRNFSDFLIVSTPDLLMDIPSATYLPNPVDTELFKPIKGLMQKGTALFFLKKPDSEVELDAVKAISEKRGLKLRVYNRAKGERVSHNLMPRIYNKYEFFIDCIKLKSLSRMALEALACGTKVIKKEQIITQLSKEHMPELISEKLIQFYKDLV